MKRKHFIFFIILSLFSFQQVSLATYGMEENVSTEFRSILEQLLLQTKKDFEVPGGGSIKVADFFELSREMRLIVKGRVFLGEHEVSALNRPFMEPPEIEISITKWQQSSYRQKEILVLHEMVFLSRQNDADYRISRIWYDRIVRSSTQYSFLEIYRFFNDCQIEDIEWMNEWNIQKLPVERTKDLVLLASQIKCIPALHLLKRAKVNMTVCATNRGGNPFVTPMIYALTAENGDFSWEVFELLFRGPGSRYQTCGYKMLDICQQLASDPTVPEEVFPRLRLRKVFKCSE